MSYDDDYEDAKWRYSTELKAKLDTVEKALQLLRSGSVSDVVAQANASKGKETASRRELPKVVAKRPPITDTSYLIDTVSEQRGTCPNCFLDMPLRTLRKHMATSCASLVIPCPEPGCQAAFPKSELKRHLSKDCLAAKARRAMVVNVEARRLEESLRDPLAELRASKAAAKSVADSLVPQDTDLVADNDDLSRLSSPMPQPKQFACRQCGDSVAEVMWTEHHESLCRNRIIYCPNKRLGCCATVQLSRLHYHLNVLAVDRDRQQAGKPVVGDPSELILAAEKQWELESRRDANEVVTEGGIPVAFVQEEYGCVVERRKEVLVARSKKRRELVQCTGCGQEIPLMYLRRHEIEQCENRKVHCRNFCVGCNVMVRLRERALHESVFQGRQTRSCLYLNGAGTHMKLDEDDIPCPWTVEYWIYRPSAQESAKRFIRASVQQALLYVAAYLGEKRIRDQVADLRELLSKPLPIENSENMTKQELAALRIEQKQEMLLALQMLVIKYEKSVLATCSAWQQLQQSINGALSAIHEFKNQLPSSTWISSIIPPNTDSLFPPSPPPVVSLLAIAPGEREGLTAAAEDVVASENAAVTRKGANSPSEELHAESALGSAHGSNHGTGAAPSPLPEAEKSSPDGKAALLQAVVDASATAAPTTHKPKVPKSCFGSRTYCARDVSMSGLLFAPEVNLSESVLEDQTLLFKKVVNFQPQTMNATAAKKREKEIAAQAMSTFKIARSFYDRFSVLLKLVFTGKIGTLSEEVDHARYLVLFPPPPRKKGFPEEEDADTKEVRRIREKFWHELQHKMHIIESTVHSSWFDWNETILALKYSLEADDARLQQWREELNLIDRETFMTIRDNSLDQLSAKKYKNTTKSFADAQKQKKKDKALLRRERKKQKKQESARAETDAESQSDIASNTGAESVAAPASPRKTTPAAAEPEEDEGERLTKKLKELFAAGAGTDEIALSSTKGAHGAVSKIFLNMLVPRVERPTTASSGVDATASEQEAGTESVTEEKHETSSTASATSKKKGDTTVAVQSNPLPTVLDSKVGVVSLQGELGISNAYFDCTIPRQKWTHLALVCTRKPKNRITCYKNGMLAGHVKNISFPLPMASIGGGANHQSYQGCFLDIRYWNKQRSSKEIKASMHCLIELNMEGAESNKKAVTKRHHRKKSPSKKTSDSPKKESDRTGDGDGDVEDDSDEGTTADSVVTMKSATKKLKSKIGRAKKTSKPASAHLDLSDRGLVGWWTFEDGWQGAGKGGDRATDVTEHRYKTQILRDMQQEPAYPAVRDLFSIAAPLIGESIATRTPTPVEEIESRPNSRAVHDSDHVEASIGAAEAPTGAKQTELPVTVTAPTSSGPALPSGTGLSLADQKRLARDAARVSSLVEAGLRHSRKVGFAWIDTECMPCDEKQIKLLSPAEKLVAATKSSDSVHSIDTVAPVPLPSFRLKNICPYELRRFRLAQAGRMLQKEVVCPMACGKLIRKFDLRLHLRYDCEQRLVPCRFEHCMERFPAKYRERHELYECDVIFHRNSMLETAEEANRVHPCALCSQLIRARHMKHHEDHECPHRLIFCPHGDCKATMQAHTLPHHLKFECESEEIKTRYYMIERARKRSKYARPWGITMSMNSDEDDDDEGNDSDSDEKQDSESERELAKSSQSARRTGTARNSRLEMTDEI